MPTPYYYYSVPDVVFDATSTPIPLADNVPWPGSSLVPDKGTYKITISYNVYMDTTPTCSARLELKYAKNGTSGRGAYHSFATVESEYTQMHGSLVLVLSFNGSDVFSLMTYNNLFDGNYAEFIRVKVLFERLD